MKLYRSDLANHINQIDITTITTDDHKVHTYFVYKHL